MSTNATKSKGKKRKANAKAIRKDVQELEDRLKKQAERIVKPVPNHINTIDDAVHHGFE